MPRAVRPRRSLRVRSGEGRDGSGDPHPQQDRPDEEDEAAANHRAVQQRRHLRRDHPGVGRDRRECRPPGARFIDRLPEGEPLYPADYLTDQPERVMAAEIVREKVLQFTHAEIPFSSAVVVDRFEEPAGAEGPAAALLLDCRRARVAEADRRRPGRRDDQAHRHGGPRRTRAVLCDDASSSTCTCA